MKKARVVMKFGGASMASTQRIRRVAQIISDKQAEGIQAIVVVSAMGNTTDKLLGLAHKIARNPSKREQDMLVSVGERISMSLLAMALEDLGVEAISFTGSQSGIITCDSHTRARILDVRPRRLLPHLEKGKVVIVAGFQGVSAGGEITTLGRSGSDTTAVALACALSASKVEFYKDVKGIYSADPKKNSNAIFFETLTYDQALEITSQAPVLHPRCVALAKKNRKTLCVLPFNGRGKGTQIEDPVMDPCDSIQYEEVLDGQC